MSMSPDTRPTALRAVHLPDTPHLHLNSRKEVNSKGSLQTLGPPLDPRPHTPDDTVAPTALAYSAPPAPLR